MQAQQRRGEGANQDAVRRHNLGTLLRHVHLSGGLSRADLTARMGLNRSTIAGLATELEELGVVVAAAPESRPSRGRVAGRPSAGVRVAEGGPYVVAVDLGVDRVSVARVGLGGSIHARATDLIGGDHEAWRVGAMVAGLVREVVADAPADAPLIGIGIGVPGLVRRSDGLVRQAPNLEWRDVSFGSIVLAALGVDVPVSVANDAHLGALAEHQHGAGVGVDDLVYLSGNAGVGAGLVVGGRALDGTGGYAGEVGHIRHDPGGRPCHCGNTGCWETVVGGAAIAEALGCGPDDVARVHELLGSLAGATAGLRAIGVELGAGLANIVNAFNPELIVLGGYFRALYPLVHDEVDSEITGRALPAPVESARLALPGLGEDSVLLGAAEMALAPLFDDLVAGVGGGLLDVAARLSH